VRVCSTLVHVRIMSVLPVQTDNRLIEYVDHLHRAFEDPAGSKNGGTLTSDLRAR